MAAWNQVCRGVRDARAAAGLQVGQEGVQEGGPDRLPLAAKPQQEQQLFQQSVALRQGPKPCMLKYILLDWRKHWSTFLNSEAVYIWPESTCTSV